MTAMDWLRQNAHLITGPLDDLKVIDLTIDERADYDGGYGDE